MWFHPTLDGMVASLEEAHQIIVAQSDTIATLQARIEIVDAALKTALAIETSMASDGAYVDLQTAATPQPALREPA